MKIFEEGFKQGDNFANLCLGKIIASMFLQESTRTSDSIKAAIVKLGGGWFGMDVIKGIYLESMAKLK